MIPCLGQRWPRSLNIGSTNQPSPRSGEARGISSKSSCLGFRQQNCCILMNVRDKKHSSPFLGFKVQGWKLWPYACFPGKCSVTEYTLFLLLVVWWEHLDRWTKAIMNQNPGLLESSGNHDVDLWGLDSCMLVWTRPDSQRKVWFPRSSRKLGLCCPRGLRRKWQ